MGLGKNISIGVGLYALVLVVLMVLKNKQKVDSAGYNTYSTMVTIWYIVGFIGLLIIFVPLGAGPLIIGIFNDLLIEKEYGRPVYGRPVYGTFY